MSFTYGLIILLAVQERAGADEPVNQLIAGLLARREAIISCRMKYRLTCGVLESRSTDDCELVVQGPSWKLFYDEESPRVDACHEGQLVNYIRHRQKDGSFYDSAKIQDPEPLNRHNPYHPTCAGTVWYSCTAAFIQERDDRAQVVGQQTIAGANCTVLEWSVSREDRYRAFESIGPLNQSGGRLRVCVAPQWGYVVPRLEHLSPDGQVTKRFSAEGFDVYNGVYLPRTSQMESFSPEGSVQYFVRHEIRHISDVNQPIDAAEFAVSVKAGTLVADERSGGTGAIWEAGAVMVPQGIQGIQTADGTPSAGGTRWPAVLIGSSVGVLLLMVLWVVCRPGKRR